MPFQIGQVVTFINPRPRWRPGDRRQTPLNVGERYTVRYVSPGGTAIQVEGSPVLWYAERFTEAPLTFEPLATAIVIETPPPPFVEHLKYDIHPFFGCCGACIIYAKYQQITDAYLKEVLEREDEDDIDDDTGEIITFGEIRNAAFLILNEGQHSRESQNVLHDNGFVFLTTSVANGGGALYTYVWHRHTPLAFTPIERNRAF